MRRPHRRREHGPRARARAGASPCSCTDVGRRARAGAGRRGRRRGARRPTPRSPQRADVVVLCHKPAQLDAGRRRASRRTPRRSSRSSAATPLADAQGGLPGSPGRTGSLPNTPVEVRQGAVILAADDEQDAELDAAVRELFERARARSSCSTTRCVDVAMGLMSSAPGLLRARRRGAGRRRRAPRAARRPGRARWSSQTMAGTAELLRRAGCDTLGGAPRGHLAGRLDRARARRARARRACAPRSRDAL